MVGGGNMASPIMLPGWGQSLGNAAGAFGNELGNIINPNLRFQEQIKAALADPAQAQQMANMYATNPSIFNPQLYGQNNVAAIASLKPDANYMFQQQVQGDTRNSYQNDPTFKSNYQAKVAGVPNPTQQKIAENTVTTTGNEATSSTMDVAKRQAQQLLTSADATTQAKLLDDPKFASQLGLSPEDLIKLKEHIKSFNDQQGLDFTGDQYLKANPKALDNPKQLAADIIDGTVSAPVRAALTTGPYAEAINASIREEQHRRDLKAQLDILDKKETGLNDRNAKNNAARLQTRTNNDSFTKNYFNAVKMLGDKKANIKLDQAVGMASALQADLNKAWSGSLQDGHIPRIIAEEEPIGWNKYLGFGSASRIVLKYIGPDGKTKPIGDPTNILPDENVVVDDTNSPSTRTPPADKVVQNLIGIIDASNGQLTAESAINAPSGKNLTAEQKKMLIDYYAKSTSTNPSKTDSNSVSKSDSTTKQSTVDNTPLVPSYNVPVTQPNSTAATTKPDTTADINKLNPKDVPLKLHQAIILLDNGMWTKDIIDRASAYTPEEKQLIFAMVAKGYGPILAKYHKQVK